MDIVKWLLGLSLDFLSMSDNISFLRYILWSVIIKYVCLVFNGNIRLNVPEHKTWFGKLAGYMYVAVNVVVVLTQCKAIVKVTRPISFNFSFWSNLSIRLIDQNCQNLNKKPLLGSLSQLELNVHTSTPKWPFWQENYRNGFKNGQFSRERWCY